MTFLTIFIGPALVLIGWRVVYFNARRIATRSESKSIVDSLSKIINEISECSVDFWGPDSTSAGFQKYLLNVLSKSSQLQHYVNVLMNRGVKLDIGTLSAIGDSATLDAEYVATMSDDVRTLRAHQVVESCMQGLQHVFTQFELVYPPEKDILLYEYFHWSQGLEPSNEPKPESMIT
jgi:hypothetical protein